MRQLSDISQDRDTMSTMVELTGAFEGIASMRIAQVKEQTQRSAQFFTELWLIYKQIRVDDSFHFGRSQAVEKPIDKELLILITSEGSFSGDIDERLIKSALKYYKPERNDIIVIGHHGAVQLVQNGIFYVHNFKMPERDRNINVTPIIKQVLNYASTKVYYQTYLSLMDQQVQEIKLGHAVIERGKGLTAQEDTISEHNFIFEPSAYAVVDHLERSMMQITLSEVILESKLAQYASRFRAMTTAHDKATESFDDTTMLYNRAKRRLKDERLKEVLNGLRKVIK